MERTDREVKQAQANESCKRMLGRVVGEGAMQLIKAGESPDAVAWGPPPIPRDLVMLLHPSAWPNQEDFNQRLWEYVSELARFAGQDLYITGLESRWVLVTLTRWHYGRVDDTERFAMVATADGRCEGRGAS